MSIDNKATATTLVWTIISVLVIALSYLLLHILLGIDNGIIYIIIAPILVSLTFTSMVLKYFKLEISENLISISYGHPLIGSHRTASLELPWYKISFCRLEKVLFFHYIYIGVLSKNRTKVFHYNLGILSKKNIDKINKGLAMQTKALSNKEETSI